MGVKLYVIPGHGAGDPGAGGTLDGVSYDEAERVRVLASRIKELGGDAVEVSDPARNAYRESGLLNWDIPDGAQVVELHMDAADGTARGGHVIVKEGIGTDEYDEALAAMVSGMFPGRAESLRGVTWLKDANQANVRGVPYRLVENGFIDNKSDLAKFNASVDELARGYLKAFGIGAGETSEKTEQPAQVVQPAQGEQSEGAGGTGDFEGGEYRVNVGALNVRDAPGLSGSVVASYSQGQTVVLDDWYTVADGYVWGRYTGGTSGLKRYVAVGEATGKPEADDYLVKA